MTLGRYGQLDKTGDMNLLKRWFNPFPVKWFSGRLDKFQQSISEVFQSSGKLYEEFEKLYMANKLLQISILYDALYNLMIMRAPIKAVLELTNTQTKEDQLLYYIDQVKKLTGIEIKEMKDLLRLQSEFTRLTDKFSERFPVEEKEEDQSFNRAALSVFSIMEMPYNPDMTLAEFADLQQMATDRAKRYQKKIDDGATG